MKNVNIVLEDSEFKKLVKHKKDTTWHDLLMSVIKEVDKDEK